MSVAFTSARPRSKGEVTQQTIQKMLDENHHLIQCIMDYQSKGKTSECTQYQQMLHRNLVYLATIADSNQNMQSLLPAPPSQSMNMGPGGMGQSGSGQSLHTQGNLNDAMATSLPPASLMQAQMSNGPTHSTMQSPGQTPLPPTSVSMPASSHGSAVGYSHSVAPSQGVQVQSQGQNTGSYVSRGNMGIQPNQVNMIHQPGGVSHYPSAQAGSQHYQGPQTIGLMGQGNQGNSMMTQRAVGSYRPSQQGSAPQYTGTDEFYGEQFGHAQNSGHGEYPYPQPSYTESSYERTFDESSQHYYEGGNNAQYSQQQASYQQGSSQQQPFSQQQYPTQQSYTGQQQAYGPGQGSSSQYSSYQQGQGQQYSAYRAGQPGASAQAQRPYTYEQGQYGNYQP
ncbi:calcium-responsive transactivator-like isoform X2 [Conger conger]|uniref:calcium-responsive transactivator-like isoform X2 n=1 Tax=Conger conger TaxID=82655 RepID=UPI002A5A75FD|nr:calcium-responsive transactivator-like isoform X2 [Conger conger]